MYEYRIVKINVNDKEDDISKKLSVLGKEGWEMVNFQASSETHGVLRNPEAWTTFYVLIFKKQI